MSESDALVAANSLLRNFGIILAGGTLAGVLAKYLRVPDVAVLLLVGILLGPEMLGLIDIRAGSSLNQVILIFGACYILFDGGASVRLTVVRKVWPTIVLLSTVGVLLTAAVMSAAAYWIVGVPVAVAALLGASMSSTDPATLVPIFQQVPIRERVAQTVMSESAGRHRHRHRPAHGRRRRPADRSRALRLSR